MSRWVYFFVIILGIIAFILVMWLGVQWSYAGDDFFDSRPFMPIEDVCRMKAEVLAAYPDGIVMLKDDDGLVWIKVEKKLLSCFRHGMRASDVCKSCKSKN